MVDILIDNIIIIIIIIAIIIIFCNYLYFIEFHSLGLYIPTHNEQFTTLYTCRPTSKCTQRNIIF